MKLSTRFALILTSAAASISSLLAASFIMWFVLVPYSSRPDRFDPHLDYDKIDISLIFASIAILLLQRPTVPSLLRHKLDGARITTYMTTICATLCILIFWHSSTSLETLWNWHDPVYLSLIFVALTVIQWSTCIGQHKQYRAYLAYENELKTQGVVAAPLVSGSWPRPPT